jgi:hypothetical protein
MRAWRLLLRLGLLAAVGGVIERGWDGCVWPVSRAGSLEDALDRCLVAVRDQFHDVQHGFASSELLEHLLTESIGLTTVHSVCVGTTHCCDRFPGICLLESDAQSVRYRASLLAWEVSHLKGYPVASLRALRWAASLGETRLTTQRFRAIDPQLVSAEEASEYAALGIVLQARDKDLHFTTGLLPSTTIVQVRDAVLHGASLVGERRSTWFRWHRLWYTPGRSLPERHRPRCSCRLCRASSGGSCGTGRVARWRDTTGCYRGRSVRCRRSCGRRPNIRSSKSPPS